jgi:CubicO group peptidase (beta-lactamase class C family)
LPEYPQQKDAITTKMLASHLSGTRHYKGDEFVARTEYEAIDDAVDIFKYVQLIRRFNDQRLDRKRTLFSGSLFDTYDVIRQIF